MNFEKKIMIVLFLVIGVCLFGQTMAMADGGGGFGGQQGPDGSKLPVNETTTPVPEPATMVLLGSGIACLFGVRKKMRADS